MGVSWVWENGNCPCVRICSSSKYQADKSFWGLVPGTWHNFWEELTIAFNSNEDWKPFLNVWQVPSLVVMFKIITLCTFLESCEERKKKSRLYHSTPSDCWNCWLPYVLTNTHCRHETEQCKFWLLKLKLSRRWITALQMSSIFFFSCGLVV